jgi:hypothetical protein
MEIASISSIYSYLSGYTYMNSKLDTAHELLTIASFELFLNKQPRTHAHSELVKRLERIKQYVLQHMNDETKEGEKQTRISKYVPVVELNEQTLQQMISSKSSLLSINESLLQEVSR